MLKECCIIKLPKVTDVRGNLTFIEGMRHIPFPIKRIYYLYDVPGGVSRGGHAHKKLQQLILAVAGSFDITLDDGESKKTYSLNRADCGLYIQRGIWRTLDNFSSGAVCLVLTSEFYDENDYLREYKSFLEYIKSGRNK
jgi:dTDP-4-dehydrorhamnose 3,5-epimerase-like enzyme